VLFHDPEAGQALLTGGLDFTNMQALTDFYIANSRRMATAGKMLFPIPNRAGVRSGSTAWRPRPLVLWGSRTGSCRRSTGKRWIQLIPARRLVQIDAAGHMLPSSSEGVRLGGGELPRLSDGPVST